MTHLEATAHYADGATATILVARDDAAGRRAVDTAAGDALEGGAVSVQVHHTARKAQTGRKSYR